MLHKKIVRFCATLLIVMFLCQPIYAVGSKATSETTNADKNAMQCGSKNSLKGFIRKPINPPPADEYFINFHYMYPDHVMNDFTVWSSFDGTEYDDIMISQTGDQLTAIKGSAAGEIDIRVEPNMWHNILIHVKADETVSLYINGKQAKIGGMFDYPQIGSGRMTALGYIGDLSSAAHNGMGYVDNIRVLTKDELLLAEDFTGELTNWTFYTTAFLADPPVNIPMPKPLKFMLEAEKFGFPPGEDIKLFVTGVLNDQTPVVMSLYTSLTLESSNPDVIKISQVGEEFIATGIKEGTSVIKASLTYENIEYQVSKELFVSKEPVVYEIILKADHIFPKQGETATVSVFGKYTDGSEIELKEGITLKSSDSSVLKSSTGDAFSLSAIKAGDALVTATYTKDGKQMQGSLAFHVPSLKDVEVSFDTNRFFQGSTGHILLKGILTNDEVVASFESVTCISDNSQVVMGSVHEGMPVYEIIGIGDASITVTATIGGVTKSKTLYLETEEMSYSKTKSTIYTEEKVAAARKNADTYPWASSTKNAVMNTASYHETFGYDFLWNLVTDQSIPRSYAVNQPLGCLNCGKAIDKFGNYPYNANHMTAPWKLECPNCKMRFPTNDFNAYYKSGLDHNHNFDPDRADKSLLVNTLYPEKGEKWGVDDGYGYTDEKGNHYTFIAYYNHWHLWHGGVISKAITSLRDAYIYSGNMKYARAGAILLDRIADVYPDMDIWEYKKTDGFLNSDGGTNRGKVIGSIWETGLVENYLTAYDAFFPVLDDPEIVAFLSEKAQRYDLGTKDATGIRRNIEDGIVRQIFPAVQNAQIRGNNGMHQSTLAVAAVVLDSMPETKEWLDFNFKSGAASGSSVTGGNILGTFVNDVNRDGHGNEAAPGYNRLWLSQYIDVANTLAGYELYPAADLYENPKFRKMFFAMIPLMLTDKYSTIIGDSASTGNPTRYVDLNQTVLAFEHYKDPLLAQVIYFLNNNSTEGIHGNIFHEDPEQVAADIQQVIDEFGPLVLRSDNLTGYGLSVLRDGYNIKINPGIRYTLVELPHTATADLEELRSQRMAFHGKEIGDSVQFTFTVLQSNHYEIELGSIKSGSSGIYDIYMDEERIGTIDFLGSGSGYSTLNEVDLNAGEHSLRFVCRGKNEKSTGYGLTLSEMVLYDPDAQDLRYIANLGDTQKALWMYYGVSNGHGHADTLNLGINAYGLDLTPELGYPEYADSNPHRLEWVNNTISHNTVLVDRSKQDVRNKVEVPLHFDETNYVRLTDVDAPLAYQSKNVGYRRTAAMIKINDTDFYAVDFFRVQGGSEHHYSFHGAEGTVTTEGLDLAPQIDSKGEYVGTYAKEDTSFGIRPGEDTTNSGFHWLTNVRKDTDPSEKFSVDWHVKDTWNALGRGKSSLTDVHIRLTMLTQTDDVAITTGTPPRNKTGNPKELEYLVAARSGNNLDSLFTSVIEPYKGQRVIEDISKVLLTVDGKPYDGNDAACVKVIFKDGRMDYVIYSTNDDLILMADNKFTFKGFFGVYSERDGIPFYTYTNDGRFENDEVVETRYTGCVTDFTKEMSMENQITVKFDKDPDLSNIVGRYIYIKNNDVRNAVYRILGARKHNNQVILDIGDVTTIKALADNEDFSKGYLYYMSEGQEFVIPLGNESISPVDQVAVSLNNRRLPVSGTTKLSYKAAYASGAEFSELDGDLKLINTDPSVASLEDGFVTALRNGKTEFYVMIRRGGKTVRSDRFILTVYIHKDHNLKTQYTNYLTEMPM